MLYELNLGLYVYIKMKSYDARIWHGYGMDMAGTCHGFGMDTDSRILTKNEASDTIGDANGYLILWRFRLEINWVWKLKLILFDNRNQFSNLDSVMVLKRVRNRNIWF